MNNITDKIFIIGGFMANYISVQPFNNLKGNEIVRQVKQAKNRLEIAKSAHAGRAAAFAVTTPIAAAIAPIPAALSIITVAILLSHLVNFDDIKETIKAYKIYKAHKAEYQEILKKEEDSNKI